MHPNRHTHPCDSGGGLSKLGAVGAGSSEEKAMTADGAREELRGPSDGRKKTLPYGGGDHGVGREQCLRAQPSAGPREACLNWSREPGGWRDEASCALPTVRPLCCWRQGRGVQGKGPPWAGARGGCLSQDGWQGPEWRLPQLSKQGKMRLARGTRLWGGKGALRAWVQPGGGGCDGRR